MVQALWETIWIFFRGREFHTGSAIMLFGSYPKKLKIYPNKYQHTMLKILFLTAKT